ncbi:hypothetical protein [Paenibacillus camerounensis]|uniref:hypothetical protein n=1 Tax=Paenibacillus camerounensis TaxID=1243663 RepID=UPI0005A6CA40|nr:hypothetical protein [Paenibacillus camerounensis]
MEQTPGKPEKASFPVWFLSSDEPVHITGTEILGMAQSRSCEVNHSNFIYFARVCNLLPLSPIYEYKR